MNLTGKWAFFEDFGYGVNDGELTLKQDNTTLSGEMVFTETIEGEAPFTIHCLVRGNTADNKVTLTTLEHQIIEGDKSTEYLSETIQGIINSQGQMVGTCCDEDDVEGVCIFTKKS
ncbi:MAG: hypothetical protein PF444_05100 [Bacteroidales bacterium]|jgi:hypothetical protein|nr:hypothetical protein [Bacteroidales bacterium]